MRCTRSTKELNHEAESGKAHLSHACSDREDRKLSQDIFRERTSTDFPDILKLLILIEMIPIAWAKHFEAQFRMPGVEKTYESLTKQLTNLGNVERYNERRSPDAMDCDALEKANPEKPMTGAEPPNVYSR